MNITGRITYTVALMAEDDYVERDVELLVDYRYSTGYPGSYWEPPSGPELDVKKVMMGDVDVTDEWAEKLSEDEDFVNKVGEEEYELDCAAANDYADALREEEKLARELP